MRLTTAKAVSLARQMLGLGVLVSAGLTLTQPGWAQATSAGVPVSTFTVAQRAMPQWSEYHGTVASRNKVEVVALVTGKVKAVHATTGQRVRKGQVLVELESDDFKARLQAAESRRSNAQSSLTEARSEHERFRQLVVEGVVSRQMMDKSTAKLAGAEAAAAEAQAAVSEARTLLDYAVIRSPIDGIVTDKRVNPGDFAMPGLPTEVGFPSGRVLMTVYDPQVLWFEARIPERFAPHVSVGGRADVLIASAGIALQGKFAEVLPVVDEGSRTFTARIHLPAHPALKLGMFGRARFVTGERQAVDIPAAAVVERGQLDVVFIQAGGQAHLRLVRIGRRQGDLVEVLSGLSAGETVVLNPRADLRDGDTL